MNLKLFLAIAAAFVIVPAPVDAALVDADLDRAPDVRCEDYSAAEIAAGHGVVSERFPTRHPGVFVEVHLYCLVEDAPEVATLTDCTATDYSLTGWAWSSAYSAVWDTTNSFGLSSTQVLNAMNAAGNVWDAEVPGDIFGSMTQGGQAKKVGRFDGVNQQGFKNLGGGGTIAVTYTWSSGGNAVESDAGYNTRFAWGVNGESNKMDLQGIGAHEMGHTFGLGHSSTAAVNACLTMYPYGDYGETHTRTLGDGDILGINAIY